MSSWPCARIKEIWRSNFSIRPAYKFSHSSGTWTRSTLSSDLVQSTRDREISIISWNVWFDEFMFEKRVFEILRILRNSSADFVCLQEVTKRFVDIVCKDSWIRETYCVSDVDGSTVHPYGVMMMTKHNVEQFYNFAFEESMMDRSLLVAVYDDQFAVSTSHLESLGYNMNARIEQLRLSTEVLQSIDHSVFCGDFNFCSDWMENSHIPEDFKDIWPHLHPQDNGFTMPESGRFSAWRPDRILLRSVQSSIIPLEITRIGETPLDYPEIPAKERSRCVLTPSDHQGLYCKLKIKDEIL